MSDRALLLLKNQQLQQQLEKAHQELAEAEDALNEMAVIHSQRMRGTSRTRCVDPRDQIASLQLQLLELKKNRGPCEECTELRQRLEACTKERDVLRDKNIVLKKKARKLERKNSSLSDKLSSERDFLCSKSEAYDVMKGKLQRIMGEVESVTRQLCRKSKDLWRARSSEESYRSEVRRATQVVTRMEVDMRKLKAENHKLVANEKVLRSLIDASNTQPLCCFLCRSHTVTTYVSANLMVAAERIPLVTPSLCSRCSNSLENMVRCVQDGTVGTWKFGNYFEPMLRETARLTGVEVHLCNMAPRSAKRMRYT